jgi:peptidyl-prolyl cis-trans isomerase D
MFEFIRTHQRLMQFLLLLFIFPSFAFVGIESYSHFGDNVNVIAKVNGQSITQQDWESAQREQMERFRQMLGGQFDSKIFDSVEAKQSILDNLIAQRALMAESVHNRLFVSDAVLQQAILAIPGLISADGKFDRERYNALLSMQGFHPEGYEARLRQDLSMQQLNASIQSTAFSPKSLGTFLSKINNQEREVQELIIKNDAYAGEVKITDEMLKKYYIENNRQFEIPEQINAEYIVLNIDSIASSIKIDDADIKSFYEKNLKRYTVDEQRRARHILINVKKDASDVEKNAAKSKAQTLLNQLQKNPADFAKLAKENSQDSGSAEHEGDLGFFGKGMMVKPFEDMAYNLKKNDISDLVQSDYGFHIIQLTDIKPAFIKNLNEVEAEISSELKKQYATKKYAEQAEIFTNTVFEQADSLKPAANKLNLKIEVISNLKSQVDPSLSKNVVFNNQKFLKSLFSDEAIKNKHNTESIEVAPNMLISGHVIDYKPATKRPFEEVKTMIYDQVARIEAEKLAEKAGEIKLSSLKTKDDLSGFSEVKTISRSKNEGLSSVALNAILKADVRKLPVYTGIELPGTGYGIYRIGKVNQPIASNKSQLQAEEEKTIGLLAQQEMVAYIDELKKEGKVKILKPFSSQSKNMP